MSYRLLLDEHIEHEVFHRLAAAGHDVEHIDCMKVPSADYRAVLFFEDDTLPPDAKIIHAMAQVYRYEHVQGLVKTGREWLWWELSPLVVRSERHSRIERVPDGSVRENFCARRR